MRSRLLLPLLLAVPLTSCRDSTVTEPETAFAPEATAPAPSLSVMSVPVGDGRIVFVSERDGNREIYIMNGDGTRQVNLTNDPTLDSHPAISADGTQIAFVRAKGGDRDIWVMNVDGSDPRNVTNYPAAHDYAPDWSPDGTKILFWSERDGNREVYVMNADGSGQTNLTNHPGGDSHADWSPDGTKIAWSTSRDGPPQVYVMNADGTGQTDVTNDLARWSYVPAWSPDGTKIAYQGFIDGNHEVYLMNPDGTGHQNITNNPSADKWPSWSPDGTKIAFSSDRTGNEEIHTTTLGGDVSQLTSTPEAEFSPEWGVAPAFVQGECGQTIYADLTLTEDIGPCAGDGIIIGADRITLEGDGLWIRGDGTGTGVMVPTSSNVTIQHLFVQGFETGIGIETSASTTVTGNRFVDNGTGVALVENPDTKLISSSNHVYRNVIANNDLGVLSEEMGYRIYHNILFANADQIDGSAENIWQLGASGAGGGNFWSNYWGKDTDGDGLGDTDLPHEDVDPAPILDLTLAMGGEGFLCDDWWTTTSYLIWRGGWSPVDLKVTGPGGKVLSATQNDFGKDAFYYETEVSGSKLVNALILPCSKPATPGGPYRGHGVYQLETTALADLGYSVEWYAGNAQKKLQSLVDVPMKSGQKHVLATNLEQAGDGELEESFAQGLCGQTVMEDVGVTEFLYDCEGYGIIVGDDDLTVDGQNRWITGKGAGVGVLVNGRRNADIRSFAVKGFERGVLVKGGEGSKIWLNNIRGNEVGVELQDGATNAVVRQNVITENPVGVALASAGNGVFKNVIWGNDEQFVDAGGNAWSDPADNLGNMWSDYWGFDTDGDGLGDTDLPHKGVDGNPILEPWAVEGFACPTNPAPPGCVGFFCNFVRSRGGYSPVELELIGPHGERLSADVNEFGVNAFWSEDDTVVPGSKQVQYMIWGTLEDNGRRKGDGLYTFNVTGLDDLTYWQEDWVYSGGEVIYNERVEDVPLAAGETLSQEILIEFADEGPALARQIVDVDFDPDNEVNCIDPTKKGVLPVAIYADRITDLADIVEVTLEIDDDADPITPGVLVKKTSLKKDLNKDKLPDLIMHFDVPTMNSAGMIGEGVELFVTGELSNGTKILGSDVINLKGGPYCR